MDVFNADIIVYYRLTRREQGSPEIPDDVASPR
jgi:hypothetical protein